MDWTSLVVGAVVGALIGVPVQSILYPLLAEKWSSRCRRRFHSQSNETWSALERLHSRIVLLQSGWNHDGAFPKGSIILQATAPRFELSDRFLTFRNGHAEEWLERGSTDGEQLGVESISNLRLSDDPVEESAGSAHRLTLDLHTYRHFDFLATHVLRLQGAPNERKVLDEAATSANGDQPIAEFPTPCSVGLSVLCEEGMKLVLTRRSSNRGASGYWQPGALFNAVGENASDRDLAAGNRRVRTTTPEVIARRGLFEEMGLGDDDVSTCPVMIHSFAWASDLLDFKFFGCVDLPYSFREVQDRWRAAPDRSESSGTELVVRSVRNPEECRALVAEMDRNLSDWAPEAVFCTLRTLVTLRRISGRAILDVLSD